MQNISSLLPRFLKDRTGNIAISAGLTAPLFIGILALGVDYGYLTLQKRQLQQTADLAAISAAANAADPEKGGPAIFRPQRHESRGQDTEWPLDRGRSSTFRPLERNLPRAMVMPKSSKVTMSRTRPCLSASVSSKMHFQPMR